MIEKEYQDKYLRFLQDNKIDFVRIGNQVSRGKVASPKSYGVFGKGESCIRFFPDVMFCYKGKVYMREFSIKVGNKYANSDRKEKQLKRMQHWGDIGNVDCKIIASMDETLEDLKSL